MNNYYDKILIELLEERGVNYTLIPDPSYYIKNINKKFPFIGGRIDFNKLSDNKIKISNPKDISFDAIKFIKNLITNESCSRNDDVVYIGDNLTENGYKCSLNDSLKIIPLLVKEIPQHHYFIFSNFKKIIYISFENEIGFGRTLI
ncbi:hypothetical protein [Parabacteroides distasonis]|uniref:hypothetical protein n=1 Tax=Parabacteroides distasonis TaxID=823 RepID=UPI001F30CFE0|nr:hypothetical protein [Parabacteroides distasonis]MCE9042996.1 hypothetical protein [Parabacteroides distasonis]